MVAEVMSKEVYLSKYNLYYFGWAARVKFEKHASYSQMIWTIRL